MASTALQWQNTLSGNFEQGSTLSTCNATPASSKHNNNDTCYKFRALNSLPTQHYQLPTGAWMRNLPGGGRGWERVFQHSIALLEFNLFHKKEQLSSNLKSPLPHPSPERCSSCQRGCCVESRLDQMGSLLPNSQEMHSWLELSAEREKTKLDHNKVQTMTTVYSKKLGQLWNYCYTVNTHNFLNESFVYETLV